MNLKQTQKIFTLYAPIFFMTNSKYGQFEATERQYMDEKIWQDANQEIIQQIAIKKNSMILKFH